VRSLRELSEDPGLEDTPPSPEDEATAPDDDEDSSEDSAISPADDADSASWVALTKGKWGIDEKVEKALNVFIAKMLAYAYKFKNLGYFFHHSDVHLRASRPFASTCFLSS